MLISYSINLMSIFLIINFHLSKFLPSFLKSFVFVMIRKCLLVFQLILSIHSKMYIYAIIFSLFHNIYLGARMQADYTILPKRNGKSDGTFKNLQPVKFFTNYYDIEIDQKRSLIYQYSFSLDEEIPKDSSIYQYSINSIKKNLRERIGYLIHSGQMIWGDKKVHLPATLPCKFTHEGKPFEL